MADSLAKKLSKIKKVLDTNQLSSLKIDSDYIQKYYSVNKLAYSFLHSFSDQIHLGVSTDGVYKDSDLREFEQVIKKYIRRLCAKNILELATGRGAVSAYLASSFPQANFVGLDFSPTQLSFAFQKSKQLTNYQSQLGDYHNLENFTQETFDLVFIIEALCYSQTKEKVLAEVFRVLKAGGRFIVIDGYLVSERVQLSSDQLLAVQLAEKGMAVAEFETYHSFLTKGEKYFAIEKSEDISQHILPNLKRFETLASRYFRHSSWAKIVNRLLPSSFVYNALAGYLLIDLVTQNLGCYYITVLKKKEP